VPKFSVLIPARNEENFLPRCLDSIKAAASPFPDQVEIIVALNRCTDRTEEVALAGQVQDFSETVVEILTTLKEIRQRLIDIRDDVLSARRIALMIVARLAQVEKRMANLCERIAQVHARVGELQGEIVAVRENCHWWTMLGTVLVTLLLLWFAASQISMVLHGWALAKRKSESV